jgi:hypothetical protein
VIIAVVGMQTEAAILNSPEGVLVIQGRAGDTMIESDLEAALLKGGVEGIISRPSGRLTLSVRLCRRRSPRPREALKQSCSTCSKPSPSRRFGPPVTWPSPPACGAAPRAARSKR